MHPLDVNDPAVGLEFKVLTGEVETTAFAIRPLVPNLAAWSCLIDADGHRPTFRPEHPLLNQFRIRVGAVYGLRRRSEASRHNHVCIAFGLQRHLAHRVFPFFCCSMPAKTSSSRS